MTREFLHKIEALAEVQPRVRLSPEVIDAYREVYAHDGREVPPVKVWKLGSRFILVDGFHRHAAATLAGLKALQVDFAGSSDDLDDAKLKALEFNHTHGLHRSNEDKRRYVKIALDLKPEYADAYIAHLCGVSGKTVTAVRAEINMGSSRVEHVSAGNDSCGEVSQDVSNPYCEDNADDGLDAFIASVPEAHDEPSKITASVRPAKPREGTERRKGKDGKWRPAKKLQGAAKMAAAGGAIYGNGLTQRDLDTGNAMIAVAEKELKKTIAAVQGWARQVGVEFAQRALTALAGELKTARVGLVGSEELLCPVCSMDSPRGQCSTCFHSGLLSRRTYEHVFKHGEK